MSNEYELNGTILGEIFLENETNSELVTLEITPEIPQMEFEFDLEFESTIDKIKKCLESNPPSGIKGSTVTRSSDAEIIFEGNPNVNRRSGNTYKFLIAAALKKCPDFFSDVVVERKGRPIFYKTKIRIGNKLVDKKRFVDVRVRTKGGRWFNIETKKGDSRYHPQQKMADKYIREKLKKGPTYVVRRPRVKEV